MMYGPDEGMPTDDEFLAKSEHDEWSRAVIYASDDAELEIAVKVFELFGWGVVGATMAHTDPENPSFKSKRRLHKKGPCT